jgi:ribose 5-phosphate isomerase A
MILAAARACGCDGEVRLRKTPGGRAFVSDNGHYTVDCYFGAIPAPERLADRLAAIPGVVEHGLFIGIAKAVISAGPAGIESRLGFEKDEMTGHGFRSAASSMLNESSL